MSKNQNPQNDEEEKEKKNKFLLIILIFGIILCLLITIWALFFRTGDPISPDYPPQGTEGNQKPIEGDDSDKMESPEGGGAINVTYGTSVTVDLSDNTVSLYYANPNASNQNVALLIMIGDLVIAKTDLITPGNKVTELPLDSYAKSKLQVGGYNAVLTIRSYDPDSGEKAMVDTKGKITVTVQE